MGASRLMENVERVIEGKMQSQEFGGALLESQGLDPRRLADVAPMDDGIPPSLPQNVKVTPFMKALDISWDAPPINDHVQTARVEITPLNGPLYFKEVSPPVGLTLTDLPYEAHSVRVKFRDMWNRESDWTVSIPGTPAETADYKINLSKAQQAGRLEGMLPALNESAKSGNPADLVKGATLAQPDGTNLLPLLEVDFDQWTDGQVWSPPDTDKAGNKYITHIAPAGSNAVVRDRNGLKWLELVRDPGTTDGWYFPFSTFKNRGIQPETDYIGSVFAQGATGTRVRLEIKLYKDVNGLDPFVLQTDVVTLDGSNAGTRLFRKFRVPAGYNVVHFVIHNVDAGTTSRWTKFQLEHAGGKLEPSAWTPGILTTGVLVARMLTAMDASIVSGIFKNASIDTAAIKELTADKIVGGTISTTTINVLSAITLGTNGVINAGPNIKIDSGGMNMARVSGYGAPSVNRAFKIASQDNLSAMNFYVNGTNSKGVQLRADGGSDGIRGAIALQATRAGDFAHKSTARVEVIAGETLNHRGYIYCDGDIYMEGKLTPIGGISARESITPFTIGANSVAFWDVTDTTFRYFFPQAFIVNRGWAPLGFSGTVWATIEQFRIYITNDTGASVSVRWSILG